MEFFTTQRGARSLIYGGHKYIINRRGRDGCIFWRCAKSRQCKAAVTTKENEIISSRSDKHNHPPNEAEIVASMAVEKMKQQVQEKINPVPAIYQQQLWELSPREDLDQVAANLPCNTSPLVILSTDCNVNGSHQYLPPEKCIFVEIGPKLMQERTSFL